MIMMVERDMVFKLVGVLVVDNMIRINVSVIIVKNLVPRSVRVHYFMANLNSNLTLLTMQPKTATK